MATTRIREVRTKKLKGEGGKHKKEKGEEEREGRKGRNCLSISYPMVFLEVLLCSPLEVFLCVLGSFKVCSKCSRALPPLPISSCVSPSG